MTKPCLPTGLVARLFLALALSAGFGGAARAAPPMSVENQALVHWIHYKGLNVSRTNGDTAYAVVESDPMRWWFLDPRGRGSGSLVGMPSATDHRPGNPLQPTMPTLLRHLQD